MSSRYKGSGNGCWEGKAVSKNISPEFAKIKTDDLPPSQLLYGGPPVWLSEVLPPYVTA